MESRDSGGKVGWLSLLPLLGIFPQIKGCIALIVLVTLCTVIRGFFSIVDPSYRYDVTSCYQIKVARWIVTPREQIDEPDLNYKQSEVQSLERFLASSTPGTRITENKIAEWKKAIVALGTQYGRLGLESLAMSCIENYSPNGKPSDQNRVIGYIKDFSEREEELATGDPMRATAIMRDNGFPDAAVDRLESLFQN